MATINWFPGHMKKTKREIEDNLKLVDAVIEIRDARIPRSSANPDIDKLCAGKPRLILLNKSDLTEAKATKDWINELSSETVKVLEVNCLKGQGLQQIKPALLELLKEKHERAKAKGLVNVVIRVMVVGIPNVGKSTFINKMAKNNIAKTGDRPGVTKSKQWIKTPLGIEMLDTPGVLWPKFEDQLVGLKLALTGAIKDDLLPMDEVTIFGLNYFLKNYRTVTMKRYKMTEEDLELEIPDLIMELTARFGFRDDYDRFYNMFVKDVRDGKLGLFCLDEVGVDGL